ncbi:DUF2339 domain-containing protein [Altererythrobacter salegens]|uniref:DUF2339 domain-containing protein n=1 Tax=Croceibacterium salegens TaxID=1737568 RepID=A0A6I4SU69_9SPHN|nr:DUF2339 domain-containing protein [Croceibacterium salegens]MXO58948.1 DUF2339 domain-containing protein [Croceibacterium salegens]
MEFLLFLGLAVIVWQLWSSFKGLERRIDEFERQLGDLEWRGVAPLAEPSPATVPAPSVPKVARTVTTSTPAPTPPPEPEPTTAESPVEPEPAFEPRPSLLDRLAERRLTFDFEDVFGRRLPIWGGGIALALAGIFLVKYSIEAGLLTPPVRVAFSFAFGVLLLAAAELAYRQEHRIADPRVRQALAGAGLATLYAAFYLAGTRYGLIGPAVAFGGLAAITAAAIALSYRFGLPCAVLGLVGGFAAPALVASDEANVPVLTLYLALVTGGLTWTGGRQGRPWLGYLALAAAFVWGGLMLLGGVAGNGDFGSLGLYIAAVGVVLPLAIAGDPNHRVTRLAAAVLGTLQMAALVEQGGNAPLTWGLYLLLGAALAFLGWRDPRVREGSGVAAALGVWLLFGWDIPPAGPFAAVCAGYAAIFLAVPLAALWLGRARQLDLWQVSLAAPALAAAVYWLFGSWYANDSEPGMAAACAGLGLFPALAAARCWRDGTTDRLLSMPLASTALLAFAALLMLSPEWFAPVAAAIVAGGLLVLFSRRRTRPLAELAWVAAIVALLALLADLPISEREIERLGGGTAATDVARALLRWAAVMAPFAGLAWFEVRKRHLRAAEALAALVAYGLVAQVMPGGWLAWTAALGAIGVALAWRERGAAGWTVGAVAGIWAMPEVGQWLSRGIEALTGPPMLTVATLSVRDALLHIAPVATAALLAWWSLREASDMQRRVLAGAGLAAATIGLHIVFKHALAIDDIARFRELGMAERALWDLLLAAAALAASRFGKAHAKAGEALGIALLLAHFTVFTLLLRNPLTTHQAIGPAPMFDWLALAYALALIALWDARRLLPEAFIALRPVCDGAMMLLIALLALSELRHLFAGTVLTDGFVGQSEDLLRSLLGIVLALAFLWWGSRSGQRSWRIGSLVLMLLAVGKVFLVDAAGLEGLLRIASFLALGVSLIGIGWVYSRQLGRREG